MLFLRCSSTLHQDFRADKIIEDFAAEKNIELKGSVDGWTQEEMRDFIEEHQIPCPTCGKHNFTDIRQFNLMFKTFQGVTEDAKNTVLPVNGHEDASHPL